MIQEKQPYVLFPKFDSAKGKERLQSLESASIMTNYYKIQVLKGFKNIYQYSIGFEPELPADASKVVDKLIESIKRELKTKLGYICHKGRMMWGNSKQDIAQIVQTRIELKGEEQQYEVILKPIENNKPLSLNQFIAKDQQNLIKLSQILNISIKNALKRIGYKQLDRGKYYNANEFQADKIKQAGLSVWRGYQVTVTTVASQLYLRVDVCSRILRLETFLDSMKSTGSIKDKAFINQKFKESSLITRYGNHNIYRIAQIDYSMTPKSLFPNTKTQKMQSFLEYYKNTYNCTIKDLEQPLIKVIVQNCQKEQVMYLVPQLVSLTGLTEEQRNDFHVMKAVAEWTKLRVDERVKQTNKIVQMLNNNNQQLMLSIEQKAHEFPANISNSPGIEIGKKRILQPNKGQINLREQILDPINLKDYFFVYSSRGGKDDEDADATYDFMLKASRAYGIKLSQPHWIDIKCERNKRLTAKDWIAQIQAQVQKGKPQFVILYFNNDQKKDKQLYEKLKSHLIHKLQLNSQVITKKTLCANAKGGMSKASKILLQINDKMGHPLYKVEKQHSYWNKNSVAIGSLSMSGGPKGLFASFVGTRSNDLTQHFSDFCKISVKQKIPDEVISSFVNGWLKEYFKTEGKKLPETVIIYREGLNEKQASKILQEELNVLYKTFEDIKQKAKKTQWKPKLIYLLINQKTGTRIYDIDQRDGKLSNPLPGTIIGSQLSKDNSYEFLMASAQTTEGTCNMVQYKVAYDSSNQEVPHQALKILTYEQCYNYPNWAGSIRFPAPVQKANKLAKFISTHGETKIDKNNPLKALDYYI